MTTDKVAANNDSVCESVSMSAMPSVHVLEACVCVRPETTVQLLKKVWHGCFSNCVPTLLSMHLPHLLIDDSSGSTWEVS